MWASREVDEAELNFLVLHHLHSLGVTSAATEAFEREALEHGLLPRRYDAFGSHPQTYEECRERYAHVEPNHLLRLMRRLSGDTPQGRQLASRGVTTLVGVGTSSLVTAMDVISLARARLQVPLKLRSVDSTRIPIVRRRSRSHAPLFRRGRPVGRTPPPTSAMPNAYGRYSAVHVTLVCATARSCSRPRSWGPVSTPCVLSPWSPKELYCVIFDKTGRRLSHGSDDTLVKIWSAETGLLLHVLWSYR